MTRHTPKVIRLTRRGPAPTIAKLRQARIEADTEAAVSALLETQPDQHRVAVLRAAHRVVTRQLAKIDGRETTATMLSVEAGKLWPPLQVSVRSIAESDFAELIKRAGGVNG